jgi:hypothetical protein
LFDNGSERFNGAFEIESERKYLNLILDDFYICKERLKVYKDICPTILSERYGLKIIKVMNEKGLCIKSGEFQSQKR